MGVLSQKSKSIYENVEKKHTNESLCKVAAKWREGDTGKSAYMVIRKGSSD